ncbi:hypothetical protein CA12_00400 [Alienimonas californiensis]|uniref:Uncharacterized protein n=1 Tax=Alienimonas californiensis TaxID=2527989 RepID=A0A517P3M4_9PLAN|nr:hypothetical protein CA12_00400 [Alienimonas californiensis]
MGMYRSFISVGLAAVYRSLIKAKAFTPPSELD